MSECFVCLFVFFFIVAFAVGLTILYFQRFLAREPLLSCSFVVFECISTADSSSEALSVDVGGFLLWEASSLSSVSTGMHLFLLLKLLIFCVVNITTSYDILWWIMLLFVPTLHFSHMLLARTSYSYVGPCVPWFSVGFYSCCKTTRCLNAIRLKKHDNVWGASVNSDPSLHIKAFVIGSANVYTGMTTTSRKTKPLRLDGPVRQVSLCSHLWELESLSPLTFFYCLQYYHQLGLNRLLRYRASSIVPSGSEADAGKPAWPHEILSQEEISLCFLSVGCWWLVVGVSSQIAQQCVS